MLNDELLREKESKWPDRFSRRVACNANPESFRGRPWKLPDVGEGGGGLSLVEVVLGRSAYLASRACRKAFNTGFRGANPELLSPKDEEFKPAYFDKRVGGGFGLKRELFSDANASNGKLSTA